MTCFTLQGSFANAHRKDSFIPFLTLHLEDIFTKKVIFVKKESLNFLLFQGYWEK